MTESNLVLHAKKELELIGETDEWYIENFIKMVQTFADCGHSGSSAAHMQYQLGEVLSFRPLSPLTDDPDEWQLINAEIWGSPGGIYQSRRNPEAFSEDGGKTFYLLSEKAGDGVTPIHNSTHKEK